MYRFACLIPIILFCAGCGSDVPARDSIPVESLPPGGSAFDPVNIGRVTGRVAWTGPIPDPPGFLYGVPRASGLGFEFRTAKNPNRPQIDPATHAVGGAVVFLRGLDSERGRPWHLPPVKVEVGNGEIAIVQGERRGRTGFVRRGDSISVSSIESKYHVLRGRGDAFFSLTLPDADRAVARVLAQPGRVELSSGTGMYWARADLFVSEHPYYTTTDSAGRFTLDRVPVGTVEVVVWMPGWLPAKQERDPDSTQVARQSYTAPFERTASVIINSSKVAEVVLTVP